MRRKIFYRLFAFILAAAAGFAACDMFFVEDGSGDNSNSSDDRNVLTRAERDEMERTGRFLKLINMPAHTQITNVFSVQISNSASVIGKLPNNAEIWLFIEENNSCTVYLPLVYNNNTEFMETGKFIAGFEILVDAVTVYSLNLTEKFLVSFTEGRGTVDVNALPVYDIVPGEPGTDPSFLVIYNLPPNISLHNISNLSVHNQAGAVASCLDYSSIQISVSDNKAAARVPLSYNNFKTVFTATGVFYVSFDINVDIDTRYLITTNDRVRCSFLNGNGFLDIENIPANIVPYLTLQGLPYYTTAKQISNVSVYNLAGTVASGGGYDDITVFRENEFITARIPLSSSKGGYFTDTGRFAVSFTVDVDVETQISFSRGDNLILTFSDGSAIFDYNAFFGYFDAQLTNAAKPTIKGGSSFSINGYKHTVASDLTINAYAPLESCVLYLYTFRVDTEVFYEFSKTAPVYSANKKGWYNNSRRALWKMIYLHDVDQYLFKTYIEDDFPQLGTAVLTAASFNSFGSGRSAHYSLSGSGNPAAASVTLQPGVYAVRLMGSGGGGGYGSVSGSAVTGSSSGGSGGVIWEVVTINAPTVFSAYTGSGGSPASAPSPSGTFSITGTKNKIIYTPEIPGDTYSNLIANYTYTDEIVTVFSPTAAASGGSGGGGGAGTFFYSEREKYFLCAGGGGGGSGASYLTPGGGGGTGGAIGPGGTGGAAGTLSQYFNDELKMNSGGSAGGAAGGTGDARLPYNTSLNGGTGTASYSSSSFDLSSTIGFLHYGVMSSLYGHPTVAYYEGSLSTLRAVSFRLMRYSISASSGAGGSAAMVSYPSDHPQAWLNTVNTHGAGGGALALNPTILTGSFSYINRNIASYFEWNVTTNFDSDVSFSFGERRGGQNGSNGGNNRNSAKGGGAAGGTVSNDRPSAGSAGSITIYKIY